MARSATMAGTRAQGGVGPNRPGSILWAGKQEKRQPWGQCFFLASPFIENLPGATSELRMIFPNRSCLAKQMRDESGLLVRRWN